MSKRKKYSLEVKFSICHVPFVVQAQGNDLEDLLADASYNADCPDPSKYYPIGDLPQKQYDMVVQELTEQLANAGD